MKTTKLLLLMITGFLITSSASAHDMHTLKNFNAKVSISAEGLFWPKRHIRHERRHVRRAIIIARHHRRKRLF
jgi:hypothetical protein